MGEYVLIEIISFKITRCKLTEVTGPLQGPCSTRDLIPWMWKYIICMNDNREPNGHFSEPLGNVISIETVNHKSLLCVWSMRLTERNYVVRRLLFCFFWWGYSTYYQLIFLVEWCAWLWSLNIHYSLFCLVDFCCHDVFSNTRSSLQKWRRVNFVTYKHCIDFKVSLTKDQGHKASKAN